MPFGSLWLPVLLSAAAVWIISALVWTVLPHHKSDFRPVPGEDRVREALQAAKSAPGCYIVPFWAERDKAKCAEVEKKAAEGPVGMITLGRPGVPKMAGRMIASGVYYVVVSFIVGYVARHTLNFGTDWHTVMRITGATAVASYTVALIPDSIWFWRPWSWTIKSVVDGIVYGIVTGAIFALFWPAA
jgi:hypothetical protein